VISKTKQRGKKLKGNPEEILILKEELEVEEEAEEEQELVEQENLSKLKKLSLTTVKITIKIKMETLLL
jgi:hypothetical protein